MPPTPVRLAATCLPLRDSPAGPEVLMVRRNLDLVFGGMWTFPGGAIDEADGSLPGEVDETTQDWADPELVSVAAIAAQREALEETGLRCERESMEWFSHWIPPRENGPPKRFATWFFLAPSVSGAIVVDTTENSDARWVVPREALEASRMDFPLAVPTWVTLDDIGETKSVDELIRSTRRTGPRLHPTRAVVGDAGSVLYWPGDRACDDGDTDAPGERNRVLIGPDGSVLSRVRSERG